MTEPEPRRPGDALAAEQRLVMDYPVEIEFPGEAPTTPAELANPQ